jgi:hypothetical protein
MVIKMLSFLFKGKRGKRVGKCLGLGIIALILGLILTLPALAQYDDDKGQSIVPTPKKVYHYPSGLDIEVWLNKGEGAVYHPGDDIRVYFRTNQDAYVMVYNIDTRGYVNLLYPYDQEDDFYVEGGRTYRVPDSWDEYDLTVDGPNGWEYVVAVASPYRFDLPNWPSYYGRGGGDYYRYKLEDEDPYDFIEMINDETIPPRYDYSSDVTVFSVKYRHPRWWYHPDIYYYERPANVFFGGAYIFSDFWGAEVWIDGIFYGYTPITIPALIVGHHFMSIYYNGCWVWRDHFDTYRNRTVQVKADFRYKPQVREVTTINKEYRTMKEKGISNIRENIIEKRRTERVEVKGANNPQPTRDYNKQKRIEPKNDRIEREKTYREVVPNREKIEKERKHFQREELPKMENRERYKKEIRPPERGTKPDVEKRYEKEKPKADERKTEIKKEEKKAPERNESQPSKETAKPERRRR